MHAQESSASDAMQGPIFLLGSATAMMTVLDVNTEKTVRFGWILRFRAH